jgi:hypothetical protein
MADFGEAFAALETLDAKGQQALDVASTMWGELYGAAIARAEKSEFLLARLHDWAQGFGLDFDMGRASLGWDKRHPRTEPVVISGYHTMLIERGAEVRELRARLDEVLDDREQLELRLEAAQGELKRLRTPATP